MTSPKAFETPLLRVSRISSACVRCRSAKVKCDGKLPACTACERAGKSEQCASTNEQFAKGKERNYVASLENRLERLEKQLGEAKNRSTDNDSLDVKALQPFLITEARPSVGRLRLDRNEARDVDDLVADFGFLSVNATARDFHGFTKEMSFAKLVLSTSSLQEMPRSKSNNVLPQRYAIIPLIQHYIQHVHILYPFLSETKIFASLDALYNDGGRHAGPMDHFTVRMVLAITLSSLSVRRGDIKYQDAMGHTAAALELAELVLQPGSISGVQATLLLVIFAILDPHRFNSWYLMGIASRELVDLGMHQNPQGSEKKGPETDLRLQIFDCVYVLDRSISMVHSLSFSFTDDSTGIQPPHERALPSKRLFLHSLDAAIQMTRLRRVQSEAYQKLFQSRRMPLNDHWPIAFNAINETNQWMLNSLSSITKQSRDLLRCEMLYGNVLFLTPTDWYDVLPDYGRFLVFEFALEYSDLIFPVISDPVRSAFCTSHQLWHTLYIARRFVSVLSRDSSLLLQGSIPKAPSHLMVATQGLDTLHRPGNHTANKALECLDLMEKTLDYLGAKHGYSDPSKEIKSSSASLRQTLQTNSQSSFAPYPRFDPGQELRPTSMDTIAWRNI